MRRPSPLPPPTPRASPSGPDAADALAPRTLAPPRSPSRPEPADPPTAAQPDAPRAPRTAVPPREGRPAPTTSSPDADTTELDDAVARARELAPAPASDPEPAPEPAPVAETAELAPVVPLAPRERSTADGTGADPATPEASDGPPPVGVRDVMRAARARRKALRAEVRRFTARQRHRRMIWMGVVAAVLLLVLGTVAAAYSPLLAVQKVTVEGTSALDAAAVEAALADQVGTPLAAIDESAIKAALVAFPLVETYALEARPPHELLVRVVERTPIGVLPSDAGFTLVDAAGVALSTTSTPPSGQPVIDVARGVDSPAFEALGHVMRSLPDAIRGQVTAVAATTADDVTLTLGSGTSIVWGSAEDSALKALVLEKTMAARPGAALYDVTSPQAVVFR